MLVEHVVWNRRIGHCHLEVINMLKALHLPKIRLLKRQESELARWNKAMAALPIMETLRQPLKGSPTFGLVIPGKNPGREPFPVILSTNLRTRFVSPETTLQPLNDAVMVDCLERLLQGCRGPALLGIEAEALDFALRTAKMPKLETNTGPKGENAAMRLGASYRHAAGWYERTITELKTKFGNKIAARVPLDEYGCKGSESLTQHRILSSIMKNVPDGRVDGKQLDMPKLRVMMEKHMVDFASELGVACRASVVCSILDAAASIISRAEMEGLRHLQRIGEKSVRKYMFYLSSLGKAATQGAERDELHRKLKKVLPPEAYSQLSAELGMAGGVTRQPAFRPGGWIRMRLERLAAMLRLPKKKRVVELAVARPAAVVEVHAPAPKAPRQRLSPEQQTAAIAKELPDVPREFIARCMAKGMRNPFRIGNKYEIERDYTRFERPPPDLGPITRAPRRDSLEGRMAAITFDAAVERAIRTRGLEPAHVSLAVCKVFNYPLSPSPRKRNEVPGYLTRYLNGKVQKPAKTAELVLSFMGDAGLLTSNDKTMRINVGTENPTGSAILRAVRNGFQN